MRSINHCLLKQALLEEYKAKYMEAEFSEVASAIDLIEARYHENRDKAYPPRYRPEGYSEDYVFSAPSPESSLYYRVYAVDMAGHRLDTGDVCWNKNGAAVIKDNAQETRGRTV